MIFYARTCRHLVGLVALVAVDTLTTAAMVTAETVVAVGSAVGGLIDEWRSQ